jgi:tetratricopeptide (TPR) repeat protein
VSDRTDHPNRTVLLRFLVGSESERERETVESHLEQGCLRCLRELYRSVPATRSVVRLPFSSEAPPAERWTRLAVRAERVTALLAVEEKIAPSLLRDLLRIAPDARRDAVRGSWKFQLLGLAEHLIEGSRCEFFEDVGRAAELAALAVEVADTLDSKVYPARLIADTAALAWACLGNAYRIQSDLVAAERALATARRTVGTAGSGDDLTRGEVASFLGSLRNDQARYEEAREVLDEAVACFRQLGDDRLEAKALLQLAHAHGDGGDPFAAIDVLERARALLGPDDGHLRLFAGHYQAQMLLEGGLRNEADDLFGELQPEYDAHGREFGIDRRRVWLEARLAAAFRDAERAEALFEELRESFLAREMAYDYALASLELAGLFIDQGRVEEVQRLAEEMVPLFASRQVHGHALAALAMFQQAAAGKTATARLVREVVSYLHRARNNPLLPFSVP